MRSLANENDRTELSQRLLQLNSSSTRHWGKMSAHQMICHLHDSFKAATGEKAVSPAGSVFYRTIIKWIALYAPLSWPRGVPTRPEMDQQVGGTAPAEWEKDLSDLRLIIDRFSREPRDFLWQPHPLFGGMSTGAWLRWGYLHVDHHLRQFGL